ncbi:membrane-associated guanylate kinase, WW and PDZ domain-containing protein 2-like protein [Sarcoptes scabiei]|uniref:Membrane-associated guanylate kinase, WW and PDZ domain-containing protein 2-like protein n=1 Tax=Sarcoptes scabiei TaxID=52283 RepID=A0A132AC01_SARSC|nr:membrane-associated guanylate kinase, WW and PDZ domain-containing protein 2-like protein [Sarcoptes scabiei]
MSNIVNGLTTFNRNYNDSFDNSRRSSIMSMTKKMIDLNQLQSVSRSKSSSRSIVSNRIDADDSIEENRSNHRNNLPPDSIHNEIDDRDLQIDDGYAQQNSLSNDQNDHDAKNVPNQNDTDATDCDEIKISGGSEFGQMIYFADNEDIILEIDGKVVTGFTSYDVERFLEGNSSHELKILNDHQSLPIDLRKYLSQRFARSSIDHNLQGMIRENIYAKTLPVTTRPMRAGEIDGVDYHFINQKQFIEMERSGLLLESGVYRGYYYGTPFPPRRNEQSISNIVEEKKTISNDDQINDALSNGGSKRKRNRSNNVAIDAASLPPGWERITDSHYGVYYIDHINKRTQYERPYEIELVKGVSGFGFTLIEIDKGLIVVKSLIQGGSAATTGVIQSGDVLVSVAGISVTGFQHSDIAHLFSTFNVGDKVKVTLARGHQLPINLNDEDYDIINLKIIKGIQGFGFTISEGHNGQKVKKILDIDRCSNLKQDDILLSINGVDLSLMSHLNVVELLKQCAIDVPTEFMVKRKKRFRSKTPNATLQSNAIDSETVSASLTGMIDSNVPMRNCKTPNAEMFQQYPHHQSQSRIVQSQFDLGETVPSSSIRSQQTNEFFDPRNDPRQMIDSRSGHLPMENNQLKLMIMPTANGLQPIAGLSSDNYNNFDPTSTHTYMNQTNIAENSIANINPIKSKSAPTLNEGIDFMQSYPQHPDLINQHSQSQLQRTSPLLMQSIPSINNVYKKNSNIIPQSSSLAMFGNIDIDYEYIEINLMRTENGFGFRIVGGSEDGSNVAIGSIVIGGPAHTDGNLKAGDELVAINGEYVIGASHQKVVQLISQTGNNVHIVVRRKRYLNAYDVVLHRQEYEGFGFVIISCGNCALIGRIIEGSPAHRCQRLHIRDRIVAVNGLDVTNMSHPEIVNRIKESGIIVPSDCYTCELIRGTNGYGFSIRGGAEFQGMPLFILNIAVNGPASSLLEIGDEILEINDLPTIGMTHEEAVRLISKSVPSVRLRMRHNYGGTEFLCGMMQQTSASDPILNPSINIGYNQSQQISSSQSSFTPTSLLLPRPQPNASLSTTTTTSSSPSPSSHKSPQHCQQ